MPVSQAALIFALSALLISGACAERSLQQVSANAAANRLSPSPPPSTTPSPPSAASNTTAAAAAAATLVSAAQQTAAALQSKLPILPTKFQPVTHAQNTGAVGAESANSPAKPQTLATSTAAAAPTNYVQTSGTAFSIAGKPFYLAGSNGYYLGLISDGTQYGFTDAAVSSYFAAQQKYNLNAIRTWLFINGNGESVSTYTQNRAAQPSIGVYNETVLRRFDRVIATASYYNIKLICVLSNFFPEFGGAQWYVDSLLPSSTTTPTYQSGGAITQWYTNQKVIGAFQNYIKTLLTRTNVYTGRQYINEPAIMAWEICNEPEYSYNADTKGTTINTWANTISNYIRSLDPNHLITLGDAGYATTAPANNVGGTASSDSSCNPCQDTTGGSASPNPFDIYHNFINAGAKGVDFVGNLKLPNINFATVHAYPQGYGVPFSNLGDYDNYTWTNTYMIKSRAQLAQSVGKPVILEEFGTLPQDTNTQSGYSSNYGQGVVTAPRDLVYGSMLATAAASGYAGAMPWEVYPFTPSGSGTYGPATFQFQWNADGSAALYAWSNYTTCATANGPAACTYKRPIAEPDLTTNGKVAGYCNKGQSPTNSCTVCDVGFGPGMPCTSNNTYSCTAGTYYQYVRCQGFCNCNCCPGSG